MRPKVLRLSLWTALVLSILVVHHALGQQIHRYPFETRDPVFVKGTHDAEYKELVHDVTDTTARGGQFSEHLQIVSEQGNSIYYYYPTGRAPLAEDLSVSLWVKANRPGAQLMVRVVLPKERNPNGLDEPLTTYLSGDVYQKVSRWEWLQIRRPSNLGKKQQQILRDQLKHDVDFTDAYVDRIVLNAYSGPGMTEIWVDDLEIGPVVESSPFKTTRAGQGSRDQGSGARPGEAPGRPNRTALVELVHGQLQVNDKKFFPMGIKLTDTPPKVLRDAGLNTLWLDASVAQAQLDDAARLGFWLVPMLYTARAGSPLDSPEQIQQALERFLEKDAVLFWDLGEGLTFEQAALVAGAAQQVRAADPNRPLAADIWDGYRIFARNIDLQGSHRWPLYTGLELTSYRDWLNQRRLLGRSGAFLWTWVQTHLPEWYSTLIYERTTSAGFEEPVGPQPEQIRLLTYLSLAAGCRGLGFWSDRFLADSHQGRDRLLEVAYSHHGAQNAPVASGVGEPRP